MRQLDKVFDKEHFLKLKSNPINVDLSNFKKILNTMKPYMTNKDEYRTAPMENLKRGFGIPKNHKPGRPLRPIISSINSITVGAEEYLKQLIDPIVKKCKYSISSSKEFKSKFIKIDNFDSSEFELVSFDAASLYTSINISKVVKFIVNYIYENIETFFPPKNKTIKINGEIINMTTQPPPKTIFTKFFSSILVEFNSFEAHNGFFRQRKGCSMGGKLSPSLANIYCNMLETTIIDPEFENGNIKQYFRYVDDIVCLVKTKYKNKLLKKLNSYDSGLQFTMETMTESKLIFLDTVIVNTNGKLDLEMHRKPAASENLINFKSSVSPKSYKISSLVGEIHRCNHTTSTPEALERALETTKQIFIKNQFPKKLIDQKIFEVKSRDFRPSDSKARRLEELNDETTEKYTLSLPFTSFRCAVINRKLVEILSLFTPNFKLRTTFSTIKLESITSPRLKPKKPLLLTTHCIYEFECPCQKTYIGETKRILWERIKEHRTDKKSHIYEHYKNCPVYNAKFFEKYEVDPDNAPDNILRDFIKDKFTVLEKT